ncbi:MAG: metallophosphoesterase, partial [Hyphomonadaceae bacterium]
LDQVAYLSRTPPFYMDGLFYSVRPPGAHGDVEIFVLDTHVLLSGATVYEDVLAEDGSEVETGAIEEPDPWARPANDAERNMAQWLEAALANSTARWRIVIGHHPLWSSAGSKFQQARTLRSLILPALCRYADMYLAGHEHTLELHTDDCSRVAPGLAPLPEVVSGAAAKQRPLNSNFVAHQRRNNPQLDAIYQRGMVWGFSHIEIEGETATVRMISTPDEGEHIGAPVVEFERTFARRSGVR